MLEVNTGGNGRLCIYTVEDLAEVLQVSDKTLRLYLNKGRLRGRKLGKRWFISGEAVQEYFSQAALPDELSEDEEGT